MLGISKLKVYGFGSGHFRLFPELYSSKVKKLLAEASFLYIERLQKSAQLESNGHGINALLGISTPNAWTELAESIAKEIEQVAKLPHIKCKESSICCEKEDSTGKYSISSLATSTCSGSSNRENMIRSRLWEPVVSNNGTPYSITFFWGFCLLEFGMRQILACV